MRLPAGSWLLTILLGVVGTVSGQDVGYQAADRPAYQPAAGPPNTPAYPDQPIVPQNPTVHQRPSEGTVQGPPQPPFVLTPAEEAQLDRLLLFWEKSSQSVKTFRAKFWRFEYNPAEAEFQQRNPGEPIARDYGELRYQAPDKGLFSIDPGPKGDNPRVEKWVCDGKSLFQYDFRNKVVREYKLPPEQQGKGITNGPMPFLFGAKAEQLKHRYWLRLSPQQSKDQQQIVLEASPRFIDDAQDFKMMEVILRLGKDDVMPTAVQIHLPGGKARTVYSLEDITVNQKDFRQIFEDPFHARIPSGWQKIVESELQTPAAMSHRGVAPR